MVIIGPAWPLRGGLAAFDEKLALIFSTKGIDTHIETFSLQYPNFLFPGKSQYADTSAPLGVKINVSINSINPLNWIKVGWRLRKTKPDLIIIRYWLPFFGPCLGTIARLSKCKNSKTKVLALVDNMIPHEKRWGDNLFTKYFSNAMDGFLVMSNKVKKDVQLFSNKPILLSPHPIFDHFGLPITKEEARQQLNIAKEDKIILFFGFIRKYKGLDLLLNAMAEPNVNSLGIKLMIVGEFYEDQVPYMELIERLNLKDKVILHSNFVPDNEVKKYVCSADFIIQPYRNATQSGVTPLAYHFMKPMLVTNVGALADTVPHGKVGIVVEPTVEDIAKGIVELYHKGEANFIPNIVKEKQQYSWEQMAENFIILHQQV